MNASMNRDALDHVCIHRRKRSASTCSAESVLFSRSVDLFSPVCREDLKACEKKRIDGELAVKIKLFTGPGTRRWPRFNIADAPSLKGIRSSAGSEIRVANISRGGALLQTRKRLAPGTRIQLKLMIVEGEIPLTGFVLRSSISSPKGMPRYQAAVAFDSPLRLFDGQPGPTADASPSCCVFRSDIYESLYKPIRDLDSSAGFLAASVCNAQDAAFFEACKLNDW
jgi:hypothetical protein